MKKFTALFLAAALFLPASGCSRTGTGERAVKLAILDSRLLFEMDESYRNGVDMAVKDLNTLYREEGYTVTYEFYDDGDQFQQGMEALNQITTDPDITAVIGTSSMNLLNVAADVLNSAGKLLITYYSAPDSLFENGYSNVFRNCYGERDMGRAIAGYTAIRPDMQRIAVYHSDTAYEREMVRAFLRAAVESDDTVVDVAATTPLDEEFDILLRRWTALGVDTVFVSQYDSDDAFEILRQVRSMDRDMQILGDFSFDYIDQLQNEGRLGDGIYIVAPTPTGSEEDLDAFSRRYRERYGTDPSRWTVQLYDSVRMVVDTAVRIGSTDPADIAEALHESQGYTGVSGKIVFDDEGRMTGRNPAILVSRNGAFDLAEG